VLEEKEEEEEEEEENSKILRDILFHSLRSRCK
jgi:hypothetical protein